MKRLFRSAIALALLLCRGRRAGRSADSARTFSSSANCRAAVSDPHTVTATNDFRILVNVYDASSVSRTVHWRLSRRLRKAGKSRMTARLIRSS